MKLQYNLLNLSDNKKKSVIVDLFPYILIEGNKQLVIRTYLKCGYQF